MGITPEGLARMVARIATPAREADVKVVEGETEDEWCFTYEDMRERLHVRNNSLVYSSRERNLPEQDDFVTPELDDMEKYLIYHFCTIARPRKGFPRLLVVPIPLTNDKVAVGYQIKGGPSTFELVNRFSDIRRYASNTELIKFSHYVKLSPEELYDACMAPNGKPPFFTQQPATR